MRKKVVSLALVGLFVLSASAMMMGFTYVKVSDKDCGNKCFISNKDGGFTRKCGKCGGFLIGGQATIEDGGWWQADFTCKECGHQSKWKYKN